MEHALGRCFRGGRALGSKKATDWTTIGKKTFEGVQIVAYLVGALFKFLRSVVLFLLVLYAAIWIIKRMWEAA